MREDKISVFIMEQKTITNIMDNEFLEKYLYIIYLLHIFIILIYMQ